MMSVGLVGQVLVPISLCMLVARMIVMGMVLVLAVLDEKNLSYSHLA